MYEEINAHSNSENTLNRFYTNYPFFYPDKYDKHT